MTSFDTPGRWSLQDIFPSADSDAIEKSIQALELGTRQFEARRERLAPDIPSEEFVTILKMFMALVQLSARLGAYPDLWFNDDTQNQLALKMMGRMEQILTDCGNRGLFFSLWLKDLDEENARRLVEASGELGYYVASLRRFRPFMLSEKEEQVINRKDVNGIEALIKIFEMITSNFSFRLEVAGETKSLTRDELTAYYHHPSPELRAATYQELYRVYQENASVLAEIYAHRARDWMDEQIDVRGFKTSVGPRNLANDVPDTDGNVSTIPAAISNVQYFYLVLDRNVTIQDFSIIHSVQMLVVTTATG